MGRRSGTKEELIKCEYCGEMYAASYKHCPFCNEDGTGRWDDPDTAADEEYEEDLEERTVCTSHGDVFTYEEIIQAMDEYL